MKIGIALALAAVVTTPSYAQGGFDPTFGDGGVSPFYRYDGTMGAPGLMLRQEAVGPGFETPNAASVERILYSSTDGRFGGGIKEASGLMYLPRGKVPKGGWPLLVWGHGTFGVADVCAPSWKTPTPRDAAYVDAWLARGFAVVAPDYQGLGTRGVHPYLNREGEGYSVLDAARAALSAYGDRLANRVVLAGQSQGSGAVLNATYLAPRYASELHIVATVATGMSWAAPYDAGQSDGFPMTSDTMRVMVLRMVAGNLRPGSPAIDQLLTAKGQMLRAAAAHGCSRDLVPVLQKNDITPQNAFQRPPEQVSAMLAPVDMPRARLGIPVFVGTGFADTLIPPARQYQAVVAQCRFGTKVEWHGYSGITHNGGSLYALRDAIPFVERVLAGRAPAGNCGKTAAPAAQPGAPRDGVPFND